MYDFSVFTSTNITSTAWIILVVVLLVIEGLTLGLTTIWFAGGALIAFLAALIGFGPVVQIVLFIVVSALLLIFTRPIATRYLNSKTQKTNTDALIDRKIRVTQDISNLKDQGQVVVNGIEWTARSDDDTVTYKSGDIVRVVRIEGVKLIVQGEKEE